jgi:NAD(P)-dependent dehydrogenase (short-subunit alcohol dehydrogenase family)
MEIENRVAIVTGAGRGLGRAVAEALASAGAKVVVADIEEETARETERLIEAGGGQAIAVVADVTRHKDVARTVYEAEARFGGLDILINNAGGTSDAGFPDSDQDDWERCLRLNLHGPMLAIQAAVPTMQRRSAGAIVNVSSIAGVVNGPYPWPEYAAAKAGLLRLTEAMSAALALKGIRVNAVAPNYILTEQVKQDLGRMTPKQREAIPPPLSTPEEVAGAIISLVRDDSITGQTLLWWFDEPHLAPADRVHGWLPTGTGAESG